ncbi:MAG: hypothetical protein ACKVWR_23020 [Acidimicrobiales bacterium]
MVEINLQVRSWVVTMRSCSTCDTRFWLRDGHPIDIDALLDEVSRSSLRKAV